MEGTVPFLEPDYFDFLADYHDEITTPSTTTKLLGTTKQQIAIPNELKIDVEIQQPPTKEKTTLTATRFDKFRKPSSTTNEVEKDVKKGKSLSLAETTTSNLEEEIPTTTNVPIELVDIPEEILDNPERLSEYEDLLFPKDEPEASLVPEFGEFFNEFSDSHSSNNKQQTFLASLISELDTPDSIASEFLHHFQAINLEKYLTNGKVFKFLVIYL